MITKSLLGPKRREEVDNFFDKVVDPRSNLSHESSIAGIPSQTSDCSQARDLIEVVADGRQLPSCCSDGI